MSLDPAVSARLKRNADGLIAAVVVEHATSDVLMMAWMNDDTLAATLPPAARRTGRAAGRSCGSRARRPATTSTFAKCGSTPASLF